jgi:quercetin dioxygenase-like cupin family protein
MPTQGQVLVNPETGDVFEFLETARDTQGERVTIQTTIKSKGLLVPNHFHVLQDETFEVLSGTLTVWRQGQLDTYTDGQTVVLPKNQPHNHYNASDEPVTYVHTTTPALDFDYFIENLVGLASDGKMKNGKAGLVQELVTLKYSDSKAFLADLPVPLQKGLMNVVAPLARRLGYRAIYQKYSGFEK